MMKQQELLETLKQAEYYLRASHPGWKKDTVLQEIQEVIKRHEN
jgi:hypothetical protein